MKQSPTSRSLALLREEGYLCAIVEKFVRFPPPGHRVDLWGFADVLGVRACDRLCDAMWRPGHPHGEFAPIVAVQTTTAANMAARVAKIKASPHFKTVYDAGIKVIVHGWRKGGKRGERKTWICNAEEVTLPLVYEPVTPEPMTLKGWTSITKTTRVP